MPGENFFELGEYFAFRQCLVEKRQKQEQVSVKYVRNSSCISMEMMLLFAQLKEITFNAEIAGDENNLPGVILKFHTWAKQAKACDAKL